MHRSFPHPSRACAQGCDSRSVPRPVRRARRVRRPAPSPPRRTSDDRTAQKNRTTRRRLSFRLSLLGRFLFFRRPALLLIALSRQSRHLRSPLSKDRAAPIRFARTKNRSANRRALAAFAARRFFPRHQEPANHPDSKPCRSGAGNKRCRRSRGSHKPSPFAAARRDRIPGR